MGAMKASERRWIEIAAAMVKADGEVATAEKRLMAFLSEQTEMTAEEIEELLASPPKLEDVIDPRAPMDQKLDLYTFAVRVMTADDKEDPAEIALLARLAGMLQLADDDIHYANLAARV